MKKNNKQVSYVTLHNNAVIRFQKSSRILIWAGILNVMGLVIGGSQYLSGNSETMPFYFCFGFNDFVYNLMLDQTSFFTADKAWLFFLICLAIAIFTSAIAIYLGVVSSQGRKLHLFIGSGLYLLDWGFTLLSYFLTSENITTILLIIGIHVIITVFLILAIYEYYNVINIEKRFEKKEKLIEQE